ncbi:hypothetical protein ON010_g11825 [Phytophthora cinnamomi]|nr:hypothetical protein ON010_g11825 [Phytophthora cinnamomi]
MLVISTPPQHGVSGAGGGRADALDGAAQPVLAAVRGRGAGGRVPGGAAPAQEGAVAALAAACRCLPDFIRAGRRARLPRGKPAGDGAYAAWSRSQANSNKAVLRPGFSFVDRTA